MAFFACGTRDKLNARPVGATRHFVDGGSLFGTGLIFSRCKALLADMGRRGFASAWSAAACRCVASLLARFLSSAPLWVRIPPLAHKKAPWAVMGSERSVTLAGTEGFEPPTAGTKNRSSTVELRPSMGVAKSNSSSLPNLRGHRKRHRAGVRRVSAHRWQ